MSTLVLEVVLPESVINMHSCTPKDLQRWVLSAKDTEPKPHLSVVKLMLRSVPLSENRLARLAKKLNMGETSWLAFARAIEHIHGVGE